MQFYLSLGLHEGHPSYRRSLQPLKETIQQLQNKIVLHFCSFFVGHFCPSGSGSKQ